MTTFLENLTRKAVGSPRMITPEPRPLGRFETLSNPVIDREEQFHDPIAPDLSAGEVQTPATRPDRIIQRFARGEPSQSLESMVVSPRTRLSSITPNISAEDVEKPVIGPAGIFYRFAQAAPPEALEATVAAPPEPTSQKGFLKIQQPDLPVTQELPSATNAREIIGRPPVMNRRLAADANSQPGVTSQMPEEVGDEVSPVRHAKHSIDMGAFLAPKLPGVRSEPMSPVEPEPIQESLATPAGQTDAGEAVGGYQQPRPMFPEPAQIRIEPLPKASKLADNQNQVGKKIVEASPEMIVAIEPPAQIPPPEQFSELLRRTSAIALTQPARSEQTRMSQAVQGQKDVRVNIGRIEINASRPVAPSKPPVRGFDEYIMLRTYLDRHYF